jgi:hypothetical protein
MSNTTAIGSICARRRGVGVLQLARQRRGVATQPGLGQRATAGQLDAVEGQAQELGEARLARAVEARDPRRRLELEAVRLGQLAADAGEQADVLLVDAAGHALVMRVVRGEAAGDDVLVDLGGQLGRGLLVEVDDRRDVAGDVRDEEIAELHRPGPLTGRSGAVVAIGIELAHERQPGLAAALARVQEDDGDVAGPPVEVLEQGRDPEERVERAAPADEHQGALGLVGVGVGEGQDLARDVGGDAGGAVELAAELGAQVVDAALGGRGGGGALGLDHALHLGVAQGAQAAQKELVQGQGQDDPARRGQVADQLAHPLAQLELVDRIVGDDRVPVVAHRADARPVGVDQIAAQGGEGEVELGARRRGAGRRHACTSGRSVRSVRSVRSTGSGATGGEVRVAAAQASRSA